MTEEDREATKFWIRRSTLDLVSGEHTGEDVHVQVEPGVFATVRRGMIVRAQRLLVAADGATVRTDVPEWRDDWISG